MKNKNYLLYMYYRINVVIYPIVDQPNFICLYFF